jgi:serine/threonine protein kinase
MADFGIAKSSSAHSPTTVGIVVKPDYMAPELIHNFQSVDHRADLYSLGAVLYFLLSGRTLFPSGTIEEKVRLHQMGEPTRIEQIRSDLHPAIADLTHRLLAKNPEDRPRSAVEVIETVDSVFGGINGAVNFELPAPNVGQYSFATGQYSAGYETLANETAADHSGHHRPPETGICVVTASSLEFSPWEQIAVSGFEPNGAVLVQSHSQRRRLRYSPSKLRGVVAGMLLVCMIAVGLVVKAVVK